VPLRGGRVRRRLCARPTGRRGVGGVRGPPGHVPDLPGRGRGQSRRVVRSRARIRRHPGPTADARRACPPPRRRRGGARGACDDEYRAAPGIGAAPAARPAARAPRARGGPRAVHRCRIAPARPCPGRGCTVPGSGTRRLLLRDDRWGRGPGDLSRRPAAPAPVVPGPAAPQPPTGLSALAPGRGRAGEHPSLPSGGRRGHDERDGRSRALPRALRHDRAGPGWEPRTHHRGCCRRRAPGVDRVVRRGRSHLPVPHGGAFLRNPAAGSCH